MKKVIQVNFFIICFSLEKVHLKTFIELIGKDGNNAKNGEKGFKGFKGLTGSISPYCKG